MEIDFNMLGRLYIQSQAYVIALLWNELRK